MENYREIPGYPNYEVSDLGNVKNIKTNRILKPGANTHGYLSVGLCNKSKRKAFPIHKLVAIVFLDHIPDGTTRVVVDHINNDRLDNRLENLQLMSNRDNLIKWRASIKKEDPMAWIL